MIRTAVEARALMQASLPVCKETVEVLELIEFQANHGKSRLILKDRNDYHDTWFELADLGFYVDRKGTRPEVEISWG